MIGSVIYFHTYLYVPVTDECTQSTHRSVDAERVAKFCTAVDNDLDGPSTAARLLGHKIQSPQQQESLNALSVCYTVWSND